MAVVVTPRRSAAGVAEAQYEYAQQLLARGGAISGAKEKAQDLLLRAAAADHAGACLRLGEGLRARVTRRGGLDRFV